MIPPPIHYGFSIENRPQTLKLFDQVHGDTLLDIPDKRSHLKLFQAPIPADGAFTSAALLELYVFSADCIPLLFFSEDPSGPIAAVHCGWKGASAGIALKAAKQTEQQNQLIHVIMGPSIGPCCYEIKTDFLEAFSNTGWNPQPYMERRNSKMFFDLPHFVVETQLSGDNVTIHTGDFRCTFCSEPTLPSYRRDGHTDRRIRSWIVKRQSTF